LENLQISSQKVQTIGGVAERVVIRISWGGWKLATHTKDSLGRDDEGPQRGERVSISSSLAKRPTPEGHVFQGSTMAGQVILRRGRSHKSKKGDLTGKAKQDL